MRSDKKKKKKIYLIKLGLREEVYSFVENLSVLLSTGMGIISALSIIQNDTKSKRMRKIVDYIFQEVKKGAPLGSALEGAEILSSHSLSLIKAGEATGRLPDNLKVVVIQNNKERLFRSKIRSSLLYSSIIIIMTLAIGVATAMFTLPKIASFFNDINAQLPLLTVWIINLGSFLGKYGNIIVPAVVVVLMALFYFLFSFPKTKFIGHSILFHLPVTRKLIMEAELARFGFILGTMLKAGLPFRSSLSNMPGTTTFLNYKKFYIFLANKIRSGETFQGCFAAYRKVNNIFPDAVRQLIISAEKSGNLSDTLLRIGEIYEGKVESTAKNLPIILEPFLIVFNGIVIAVLALGVILPIYNLANVI